MRASERNADIPAWIEAGHLLGAGVRLVFTAREGGWSPPPYDSLNLAFHTGDDTENVRLNRLAVAAQLKVPAERIVYLEQVHGLRVVRAGRDDPGCRQRGLHRALAAGDGAFTSQPGLALAVLTADCVPLALAAADRGVAVMLHAGWRGTLGDIAAAALEAIGNEIGARPADFAAVMGPAIGPCCYGIDEGRAGGFVERYGEESGVVIEGAGYRLDLFQANRLNLLRAGVREERIRRVGGCTCCDQRYFSFRRDGVTGRQGSFVWLEGRRAEGMAWG